VGGPRSRWPDSAKFRAVGIFFTWCTFLNEKSSPKFCESFFPGKMNSLMKWVGLHFGRFFSQTRLVTLSPLDTRSPAQARQFTAAKEKTFFVSRICWKLGNKIYERTKSWRNCPFLLRAFLTVPRLPDWKYQNGKTLPNDYRIYQMVTK
jgi:hypothetical protein